MNKRYSIASFVIAVAMTTAVPFSFAQDADSLVEKVDVIRKFLRVDDTFLRADFSNVKIAILSASLTRRAIDDDNKLKGKYLPSSARWINSYAGLATTPAATGDTAQRVAQVIWAMTGFSEKGPEFRLFNANPRDPRNFREAVKALTKWGAKIVVSTVNFETYGNFDGKGFVNKLVDSVTDRNVLWIQSPGEYHNRVKHIAAKPNGNWLSDHVAFKSNADKNKVRFVLTWDSFPAGKDFRPVEKDLDFVISHPDKGGFQFRSENIQRAKQGVEEDDRAQPFEEIEAQLSLAKGSYLAMFAVLGGKFAEDTDRIRLTMIPEKGAFFDGDLKKNVEMAAFDKPDGVREIMIPSDNRSVLTVGDDSDLCPVGPTNSGLAKPDVKFESYNIAFNDNGRLTGPDATTAVLAGLATLLTANQEGFKRQHFLTIYDDTKQAPPVLRQGDKAPEYSYAWKTPSLSELKKIVEGR